MIKSLSESKERIDRIVRWCNDNDAYEDSESIEIYLYALRNLATRAVEHIVDIDCDYVKANFDDWGEYLMEEFGCSYEDFKILTTNTLPDIFKDE